MKQNLTISLDRDIIRKAKLLAAERDVSVSRLVAEELQRMTEDAARFERAKRLAVRRLDRGFHLGGKPMSREEAHRRRS